VLIEGWRERRAAKAFSRSSKAGQAAA